ncbi:MAG: TonB-dependent receptor [Panacagrimonas sp.]
MVSIRLRAGLLTAGAFLAPFPAHAQEEPAEPETSQESAAADTTPEPETVAETIPVDVEEAASDEPAAAPRVRNRLVEEIVVTAQKREENLQDVPISIQAFSGDAMAARGVENTYQLGQVVPSLQFTDVAGFTLIFMRGIGTDNFIPSADPSIATYIDGIYVPQGHTAAQSLGNVERVEVLKGPQGTLFGRNATGGAISVVTREPGDEFEASLEGEFGNFSNRQIKGSITVPLTEWLSVSGAALYKTIDNYYTATRFDLPETQSEAYRTKISIRPTDNLSLNLTAYNTKQTGYSSTFGNNTDPTLIGRIAVIVPAEDNYFSDTDLNHPPDKATQDLYYGNATWSLPWLDLKLLGSHQEIITGPATIDFDGSGVPIAAFDALNEFSKLDTWELQFLSNANTPGAEKFKWVAGLYYLDSTAGFDPAHLRVAPQALQSLVGLAEDFGIPVPEVIGNIFDAVAELPITDNTPLSVDGITVEFAGVLGTESYSAFAQGTYFFNDYWDLTLGGRYQTEDRFLTKSETGVTIPGTNVDVTPINFRLPSSTAKNFSPKVVLTAHPREDALVYLSYGVGFKSGTYNVVNIYTPPNYIEPEKVTSYELGAKVDFFNGLLRVNGAIFYNEITDLQSGFVSVLSGGAVQFINAGSATTQGVEFDGTLIPFPEADPGLAISFNAAYVDAKYDDFDPCPGFREGSGIYAANLNCSGNEIVRSPKTSGSIGLVQAVQLQSGTVEFAVDNYYNSGFYYDAFNTVEEDAYSTLSSRVSYLYDRWKLRLTVFGKNLLEEAYHIQQFQSDFGLTKTLAAPREYGLRVNWDF